jgi:hypothetical protein
LGSVNQWFQYNNLKVILGLLCELLFCYLFLFFTWVAYDLERDTENVDEVFITLKCLLTKVFFVFTVKV